MAAGILYVVATPIGHMDDLSPRAIATLRAVDAICCEDTRHSRPLLAQHGIERPLLALHEHNEAQLADRLVERLRAGHSLALISDAGTPLVSDPGFRLVRAARAAGVQVSPIPGACAAIAALAVAGIGSDRFVFEGFLPAKAAARSARLQALASETRTLVFYESSHRIAAMLADARAIFGEARQAVIARELTKVYETVLDGDLATLCARLATDPDQRRGEFVVIVAGAADADAAAANLAEGQRLYAKLHRHLPPSQAAKLAAELSGAPRKALYAAAGPDPDDPDPAEAGNDRSGAGR